MRYVQLPYPDNVSHGGSAVLIKCNLTHYELNQLAQQHLQVACIAVKYNGLLTTIASIYSPPRHTVLEDAYTELFEHLGQRWITGEDWNAKNTIWGSRLTTTKGRNLYRSMAANGLRHISNGQPTYWPADSTKIPDCIDFFLTKNVASNYTQLSNVADLTSDHTPQILELRSSVIWNQSQNHITNKHTDWNHYRDLLQEMINLNKKIKSTTDIDTAVVDFTEMLKLAAIAASPTSVQRRGGTKPVPQKIREAIRRRRRLRHRWQETRDPAIKQEFNQINNTTKKLLAEQTNEEFTNFLLSLDATKDNNFSLFKVAKAARQSPCYTPPIRK